MPVSYADWHFYFQASPSTEFGVKAKLWVSFHARARRIKNPIPVQASDFDV